MAVGWNIGLPARGLAVVALAFTLGVDAGDAVPEGPPFGAAPFEAWVRAPLTRIYEVPRREADVIGALSRGDVARVVECFPRCEAYRGFARIAPFGYVRLQDLGRGPRPVEEEELAPGAPLRFVRADGRGAITRAAPVVGSRFVARHRDNDQLALVGDARADVPGFHRRAGGGWIASDTVRLITPSAFEGTASPALPLAFVVEPAHTTGLDGSTREARRYDRFAVVEETATSVRGTEGTIPREAVRVARRRARPHMVPAGAKWVHVDLGEQTLVAYEGDTPVFATLVSSGTFQHKTRDGFFRVYQKTRSMEMNGAEETERYRVEAVANVMFFHNDLAIHSAYWHDRFGRAVSHGCVNLSPADAERVFAWAPPEMPEGYRTVFPRELRIPTLFVLVTR